MTNLFLTANDNATHPVQQTQPLTLAMAVPKESQANGGLAPLTWCSPVLEKEKHCKWMHVLINTCTEKQREHLSMYRMKILKANIHLLKHNHDMPRRLIHTSCVLLIFFFLEYLEGDRNTSHLWQPSSVDTCCRSSVARSRRWAPPRWRYALMHASIPPIHSPPHAHIHAHKKRKSSFFS